MLRGVGGLLAKSGTYPNEKLHRQTLAYYYGLVSQIDYNIGRVLDELDRLGLADNTIVVYTSDHGEMMAEHGAWTKGRTGYEATIRVPLIIRLPKVFAGGKRSDELVCLIDLLPTLLDAAGLDIPENIQGKSLRPLVEGKMDNWRKYSFTELAARPANTCIAVRSKTHKYVLFRNQGRTAYEQLFDLKNDPWETKNEINNPKYKAVAKELKTALKNWESTVPTTPHQTRTTQRERPRRRPTTRRR